MIDLTSTGGNMGHYRILGEITDFVTGEKITDIDDERIRQKIARFLVEISGYEKSDIEVKPVLELGFGEAEVLHVETGKVIGPVSM